MCVCVYIYIYIYKAKQKYLKKQMCVIYKENHLVLNIEEYLTILLCSIIQRQCSST